LCTWYRGSHIVTGIWDGILAQLGLNVLMKKEISGQYFLENYFLGQKSHQKKLNHDSKALSTVFLTSVSIVSGISYDILLICYRLIANFGHHLLALYDVGCACVRLQALVSL